jgi:hypothetical protein
VICDAIRKRLGVLLCFVFCLGDHVPRDEQPVIRR